MAERWFVGKCCPSQRGAEAFGTSFGVKVTLYFFPAFTPLTVLKGLSEPCFEQMVNGTG
jgi:hypothetical protein